MFRHVKFHSIVHVPILGFSIGASIPFLILLNGEISLLALAWARAKMLEQFSPSWLSKAISAIGRFYDLYQVKGAPPLTPDELNLLVGQFYSARRHGDSNLRWKPVQEKTAYDDLQYLNKFSDWCANNFNHVSANPSEKLLFSELSISEQLIVKARIDSRAEWNMLHHLTSTTELGKGVTRKRKFEPNRERKQRTKKRKKGPKFFPPEKIMPLIHATPSLRDRLILLLIFFGGLRVSEPFHLFVSDITVLPNGEARVRIGHPQDGHYEWIGDFNRRRIGNRAAFLKERYGLGPRNLLPEGHPLHAGWKGMLEDDERTSTSEVHWIRDDISRLFAKLHIAYMKTIRCNVKDDHPYYLVNTRRDEGFGTPLKLSSYVSSFNRGVVRVGLSPKTPGVNPHGGRHFVGYYVANVLRLRIEALQKILHHAELSSTEVYYTLLPESARVELMRAQARLEQEMPSFTESPLLASLHG